MSKRQTLLAIGIFIILIQPSGFPDVLRKSMTAVAAFALIGVSIALRKEDMTGRQIVTPVFSESRRDPVINQE